MRTRACFRRLCGLWLVYLLLICNGCASTQKTMVVPYELDIVVDAQLNPNLQAQASPLLLSVYELSSDSQFANLDFSSLQDQARQRLGADLISLDQVIVQPGERRVIHRAGNAAARRLGLVAGYRQLEGKRWRLSVPLPGTRSTNLYKFWQISPRHKTIHILVGRQGLVIQQRR